MKTYEEQLEEIAERQKTLEAQKQKLIAKHNEKEKKECVSRRLEIGKIIEEAIGLKITNYESFKEFVSNHSSEIKGTQR
ncbi:MAG: hypothetical protein Q4E60_10915 [Bacteroidales bacterium]|nr:hypothetical protein [Bacteroidales bacterium]